MFPIMAEESLFVQTCKLFNGVLAWGAPKLVKREKAQQRGNFKPWKTCKLANCKVTNSCKLANCSLGQKNVKFFEGQHFTFMQNIRLSHINVGHCSTVSVFSGRYELQTLKTVNMRDNRLKSGAVRCNCRVFGSVKRLFLFWPV